MEGIYLRIFNRRDVGLSAEALAQAEAQGRRRGYLKNFSLFVCKNPDALLD
jgi:hypothetical protein